MDAILFHAETSVRRALYLALGQYAVDAFSPGEREPLVAKLLDAYRNDPDAGIHGAAEWTLRRWNQGETLEGHRGAGIRGPARPSLVRQQRGPDDGPDRGPGRVLDGVAQLRSGAAGGRDPHLKRIAAAFSPSPPRR